MVKETESLASPPDWVLIEAAKRIGWSYGTAGLPVLRRSYTGSWDSSLDRAFRALCDLIHKHDHPPVDRKLLVAREAAAQVVDEDECESAAKSIRAGEDDKRWSVSAALRAIKLWEAGHGK